MKNRWLIIALCFMLLLSGCKAQKPQDDEVAEVITEEQGEPSDEQPEESPEDEPPAEEQDKEQPEQTTDTNTEELYDPAEEGFVITDCRVYVTYVGDGFVVLKNRLDGMRFKLYTDYKYAKVHDACDFSGEIATLKKSELLDGDEPLDLIAKRVDKAEFFFDPDNIYADTGIIYVGEDCFVIEHMRRGIKVYIDDIADYCKTDYVEVVGSATPIEPYIFKDNDVEIEVCFEMRDAEIAIIDEKDEVKGLKPVIYLYPEEETEVSVALTLDGELTCVYPEFNGAWQVTAKPDGTLIDEKGREYYCLYWEGEFNRPLVYDESVGFVIKGSDTAEFLREKLLYLGLNEREANEFIIYWLPQMEDNNYNYIYFSEEEYTESAKLDIAPNPDTLIRIMMAWEPLDTPREVTEQKLTKAPERCGFTAVEWGGARIR